MKKKILIISIFIILILGIPTQLSYLKNLKQQEPQIHAFINQCVKKIPFSFCRIFYNKVTIVIPDRIIYFFAPLSSETVFIRDNHLRVSVFLFPFYICGILALLYRYSVYKIVFWLLFITLLINFIFSGIHNLNFLILPLTSIIGIIEAFRIYISRKYA